MRLEDAVPGMRVAYLPYHAYGDLNHSDVEWGFVSSKNHVNVFVKFDRQIARHGLEGSNGIACHPETLVSGTKT